PAEPSGLAFILSEPLTYLRFVGRSFGHLFGFVAETTEVPSRWPDVLTAVTGLPGEVSRLLVAGSFLLLTLLGIAWQLIRMWRGRTDSVDHLALAIISAVVLYPSSEPTLPPRRLH